MTPSGKFPLSPHTMVRLLVLVLVGTAGCSNERESLPGPAPATESPTDRADRGEHAPLAEAFPKTEDASVGAAFGPKSADSAGATSARDRPDAAPASRATVEKAAPPADAGPLAPASRDASAPAECGTKPHPDCPLQAWMKANTTGPIVKPDFVALATSLEVVATFAPGPATAPDGYPNWVSISKDGAAAARAEKLDAVKAACRGCHEQYKTKYRSELRARALPSVP